MKNGCESCPPCSAVRLELNNLSKSIAGLLSHRLCDVVLDLRKLRAAQEQKVEYACLNLRFECYVSKLLLLKFLAPLPLPRGSSYTVWKPGSCSSWGRCLERMMQVCWVWIASVSGNGQCRVLPGRAVFLIYNLFCVDSTAERPQHISNVTNIYWMSPRLNSLNISKPIYKPAIVCSNRQLSGNLCTLVKLNFAVFCNNMSNPSQPEVPSLLVCPPPTFSKEDVPDCPL